VLSATHVEFRRAIARELPVFAFVIDVDSREDPQESFVEEVREECFHGYPIGSKKQLVREVRRSFVQEFTRCFREVHSPGASYKSLLSARSEERVEIPGTTAEALTLLREFDRQGRDLDIQRIAGVCEERFGEDVNVIMAVCCAEANIGMNGGTADTERLWRGVDLFEVLSSRIPESEAAYRYNQANCLYALEEHAAAIQCYEAALKIDPSNKQCLKNLGSAMQDSGDTKGAEERYRACLVLDPQFFEALYSYGALLVDCRKPSDALRHLNRIRTTRLPGHAKAATAYWKARALLDLGNYEEAMTVAEDGLDSQKNAEWLWHLLARTYSVVRRSDGTWVDAAVAFWRRFLSRFPRSGEGWAELGYCQWALKVAGKDTFDAKEALRAFTRAIECGSGGGLVHDRIGHLRQDEGEWAEAERAYRQAAKENAALFGYCHGTSLVFLGRHEEALPLLRAAAEKHQADAMSWFQVGVCLAETNDAAGAEEAYRRAISLDSGYAKAWFNLGGLYWNTGRWAEAKETWSKAIEMFPGDPLADGARELLDLDS
jgi:tetratricopeptide (TPR) repeat protein